MASSWTLYSMSLSPTVLTCLYSLSGLRMESLLHWLGVMQLIKHLDRLLQIIIKKAWGQTGQLFHRMKLSLVSSNASPWVNSGCNFQECQDPTMCPAQSTSPPTKRHLKFINSVTQDVSFDRWVKVASANSIHCETSFYIAEGIYFETI